MAETEGTMTTDKTQTSLDMSLDDLITGNPENKNKRRGRHNPMGRSRGPKPGALNKTPRNPVNSRLQNNTVSSAGSGSKITVSNLHPKVTRKDMVDLFSQVGSVNNVQLTFDAKGHFCGIATVSFKNAADAMNAVTKYHNVMLDGKPMHIEMIMTAGIAGILSSGNVPAAPFAGGRTAGGSQRHSRGGRFNRGGFRNRNQRKEPRTAEQLDADMDSYMRAANKPEPLKDNLMEIEQL